MNEHSESMRLNSEPAGLDERQIQRLIAAAGRRPEVPAGDMARIRAAAQDEWRDLVASQARSRRLAAPLALAASLLLVIAAGWWWWRQLEAPVAHEAVATVELIEGDVRVDGPPLALGGDLRAGAELVTVAGAGAAPARLAIRLAGGQSVRLDVDSRLRLLAPSSLELLQGGVYVDAAPAAASGAVEILTAFGNVHDIGTQFEVRLSDGEATLRVRVREGSVAVEQADGSHSAAAGEELTLRQDGSIVRATVDPYGPAWEWVVASAPSLDIEGLTLAAYLEWVARETGWEVRFTDEAVAGSAAGIKLYGTIEGLAPDESLEAILPGSGLGYRIADGALLLERP